MVTLGSYYAAYVYYYAEPFVANYFYASAGMSVLMTLLNIAKHQEKKYGITRMYLL